MGLGFSGVEVGCTLRLIVGKSSRRSLAIGLDVIVSKKTVLVLDGVKLGG